MPRALWEGAGVGTGEEGVLPGFGAQARFGGVEGIPPVLQVPTNLSRVLSSSVERQRSKVLVSHFAWFLLPALASSHLAGRFWGMSVV